VGPQTGGLAPCDPQDLSRFCHPMGRIEKRAKQRARPRRSRRSGCFPALVAVGMPVARHPPHRSPRANCPHGAPTLDEWRQGACGSTHALQPLGHAWAALCRSHVWLSDVLLGPGPSLQALRGRLPFLVRTLHWYYARVRLLACLPVGRAAIAFSHRSAAYLRRRCRPGLPVLVHDVSGRARGL